MSYFYNNQMDLPKPMDKDEEMKCFEDIRNGVPDARNRLTERNLRLVPYVIGKFSNMGIDYDEMFSIGSYGLLKAARTFGIDKNIKFATYAATVITNEILMAKRKIKPGKEVSINEPMSVDSQGNEIFLEDLMGVTDDYEIEAKENSEILHEVLRKIDPRDKNILELKYGLNSDEILTQRQIGDKLGFSQSYMSRRENKALVKLREKINELVGGKPKAIKPIKAPIKIKIIPKEEEKPMERLKMTKAAVRQMVAEGKTNDEIAEFYKPSYENTKLAMLKAKVAWLQIDQVRKPKDEVDPVKPKEIEMIADPTPIIPAYKKPLLKAVKWQGKEFEYSRNSSCIRLLNLLSGNEVDIQDISSVISELQEIQLLMEVV